MYATKLPAAFATSLGAESTQAHGAATRPSFLHSAHSFIRPASCVLRPASCVLRPAFLSSFPHRFVFLCLCGLCWSPPGLSACLVLLSFVEQTILSHFIPFTYCTSRFSYLQTVLRRLLYVVLLGVDCADYAYGRRVYCTQKSKKSARGLQPVTRGGTN